MAFKIINVRLTDEQVQQISSDLGDGGEYALLAEPDISRRTLKVQVCTDEQFKILRPAIMQAYALPQWEKS